MKPIGFTYVPFWKQCDWGVYFRRNEAFFHVIADDDETKRVIHVEDAPLRVFLSRHSALTAAFNDLGRADLALKWNLAMLCLVPPVLWMGSHYGILGLAWALLGFTVVMFIPGWYVLVRPLCKAGLLEYTIAALRPLLIAVVAIAPAYFITLQMTNVYLHMSIAVLISAPSYLGLSFLLNREWLVAMRQLVSPGCMTKNKTV